MSECVTCRKEKMKEFFPGSGWSNHKAEIDSYVKEQINIMLAKIECETDDFKESYKLYIKEHKKKLTREAKIKIAEAKVSESLDCEKCKEEDEDES